VERHHFLLPILSSAFTAIGNDIWRVLSRADGFPFQSHTMLRMKISLPAASVQGSAVSFGFDGCRERDSLT